MIRPGEPGYQAADELLHTRIVAASGNQFFQQMAAIIRGALSTVNPIVNARQEPGRPWWLTHGRVVEAIERRDPKEAEAASIAMIDYTAEEISRALSMILWATRDARARGQCDIAHRPRGPDRR